MGRAIWKSALIGSAYGAAGCAVLFLAVDRYTLAKDWFLAVMILFATTTGFALATRYDTGLIGVAVAGLAGMAAFGWIGVHTIGNYEYTVPTPREERVMRVITKGQEREIELKGVPAETVKRVPVGAGLGGLIGWAVWAHLYARLSRTRRVEPDADGGIADAEPDVTGDRGPQPS